MTDSRVLRIVVELSTREDESFSQTADYIADQLMADPNVLSVAVERPGAQRETRGL